MSDDIGASSPTGLVPGDPETLEQTAGQLSTWGGALGQAAEGLGRIDTSAGWSGKAADQFRKVFDNQPGKWLRAADGFRQAASALQHYAEVLRWAQGQAATAITTWHAGPAHHQAAQQILGSARSQLASAAHTAAQAIAQARDMAPPPPGLLSEIGHDIGGVLSSAWHGTEQLGEDAIDGLASIANAAINDPSATLQTVGGLLLGGAGVVGEGVGGLLDASVVASPAGAALNALSAPAIAFGAGLAGHGIAQMASDATGPDRVSMSQSSGGGSGPGNLDDLPPSARTTSNVKYMFQRLQQYNGISPETASARLHAIKAAFGLGGADNVTFDLSGGVYSPSGEYLGSLTQGGAGLWRLQVISSGRWPSCASTSPRWRTRQS
ncbi:MAG: hypothetical protein J2P25_18700 [Nocardiopsaceae bacterium]|nr:hypothetical protein [Nocardiopsaceae bacterium]